MNRRDVLVMNGTTPVGSVVFLQITMNIGQPLQGILMREVSKDEQSTSKLEVLCFDVEKIVQPGDAVNAEPGSVFEKNVIIYIENVVNKSA